MNLQDLMQLTGYEPPKEEIDPRVHIYWQLGRGCNKLNKRLELPWADTKITSEKSFWADLAWKMKEPSDFKNLMCEALGIDKVSPTVKYGGFCAENRWLSMLREGWARAFAYEPANDLTRNRDYGIEYPITIQVKMLAPEIGLNYEVTV